jgi:hypothetical protein
MMLASPHPVYKPLHFIVLPNGLFQRILLLNSQADVKVCCVPCKMIHAWPVSQRIHILAISFGVAIRGSYQEGLELKAMIN